MGHIYRLLRAGHIIAKYRIIPKAVRAEMPFAPRFGLFLLAPLTHIFGLRKHDNVDKRMGLALAKLGPSYIKFGQFLATRPDLVGEAIAGSLRQLQDDVPPFAQALAVAQVEKSFGKKLALLFKDFSQPVAAASIAQVHKGEMLDGTIVAVKILRPDVERLFERDISDFFFVARLAEKLDPQARRLRLIEVVATLKKSVDAEMNLRFEAAAISEMRELRDGFGDKLSGDANFSLPIVNWALTDKHILTTNWIDGTPLSDLAAVKALGLDMPKLANNIVTCFLTQALEFGFFHADMHPGNIFIKPDGGIALVDFGIVDRLSKNERRFLAEILYGFVTRNYLHNAKIHFEAGYVPPQHNVEDFALALRAIGEPLMGQGAEDVSMGLLLGQLLKTTETFDMQTQLQLVMLQKSLVIVEGVARMLDPKFDMFKAIEPLLKSWLEKTLGVEAKVKDGLEAVTELLAHLPKLPAYIEQVKTSIDRLEDIAKADAVMAEAAKSGRRHARAHTALLLVAVTAFLSALYW
ncbi:MAG: 2-polyprenylphenol 6-hydroxylase [Rhizobiales bacterium]|nr:2-polyprenylphenol 6-hydroxylase [Hyphomicrobiales bacterium]NRB14216.1 2-polyprenylphenol 6-hydroxylase [Hyphomicrobiales bacterium]